MRAKSLSPSFQRLTDSSYPLLYLLGGLLFGCLGSAAYELLQSLLSPLGIVVVVIFAIVVIIAAISLHHQHLNRLTHFRIEGSTNAPRKRGLICLVSGDGEAVRKAVAYHGESLERLWLIASSMTAHTAEDLKTKFQSPQRQVEIKLIQDADAYKHGPTEQLVDIIFANLPDGWTGADVIADFTGGTKPMTVGMVMACLDSDRALQYLPSHGQIVSGQYVIQGSGDPIYIHVVRP